MRVLFNWPAMPCRNVCWRKPAHACTHSATWVGVERNPRPMPVSSQPNSATLAAACPFPSLTPPPLTSSGTRPAPRAQGDSQNMPDPRRPPPMPSQEQLLPDAKLGPAVAVASGLLQVGGGVGGGHGEGPKKGAAARNIVHGTWGRQRFGNNTCLQCRVAVAGGPVQLGWWRTVSGRGRAARPADRFSMRGPARHLRPYGRRVPVLR